jgi:choline dehydrogenase-like flavoprotein
MAFRHGLRWYDHRDRLHQGAQAPRRAAGDGRTVELSARSLSAGTLLDADICIIGAGPAGLTLARELVGIPLEVLVLESGDAGTDSRVDDLNIGTVRGDRYADLRSTRHRGPGGTVHLWNTPIAGEQGAKFAPLDPFDFASRGGDPPGGWPFDRDHLMPFYHRAHQVCGLGRFGSDGGRSGLPLAGHGLVSSVYHFGRASTFLRRNVDALRSADNITLCSGATACLLVTDGTGRRVVRARAAALSGATFAISARIFVLAAGTIETTRLLLASVAADPAAAWSGLDWLGRGFMEHPRDYTLTWTPARPALFDDATFYDARAQQDGAIIGGRIGATSEILRAHGLPDFGVTLLPRRAHASSTRTIRTILARPRAGPPAGYGWSRVERPDNVYDAFRLVVNLGQRPDAANRIELGGAKDALGMPRSTLYWRWRDAEQAALERLRIMLASAFDRAGLGRIDMQPGARPDPNAHHHAGTTRMSSDPRHGVVDADARVHGTDNLFVSGASVFPTAGFVNPTLTIVAMAIRLADELRKL